MKVLSDHQRVSVPAATEKAIFRIAGSNFSISQSARKCDLVRNCPVNYFAVAISDGHGKPEIFHASSAAEYLILKIQWLVICRRLANTFGYILILYEQQGINIMLRLG